MRIRAIVAGLIASCAPTLAQQTLIPLVPGVDLESGDTWIDAGQRYRLFGVQACLRGTYFTNARGEKLDCGEVSLAVFAAFITDTKPRCAVIALGESVAFVSCFAMMGIDRVDLANLMISSGYAFASVDARGLPQHGAYSVIEQSARSERRGLWAFADVQHPAVVLGSVQRK